MTKLGILGGGNMGEAIISGVHKKYTVRCCEKMPKRQRHLKKHYKIKLTSLQDAVEHSNVIVVAVKPQDMDAILTQISSSMNSKKLIISIAAGITTSFIEKRLLRGIRVVRVMPNMPAMIGEGVTAVAAGRHAKKSDISVSRRIFDLLGETVIVKESLMDRITAVSGSGPGYVFLFVESMIKAARILGLKEPLATKLVEQTFLGSVHLLKQRKENAATLRAKVTSKGGTTQAAMDVFFRSGLPKVISHAMRAAKTRAKELEKT